MTTATKPQCGAEKRAGGACKRTVKADGERCRAHQLEADAPVRLAGTYFELPIPKAKHPDRCTYAVLLEGFQNPFPAELVPEVQARVVAVEDIDSPWEYPKLRGGERIVDHQAAFMAPEPKAEPQGRTIRGWRLLGEGPMKGQMAYEIPEASVISRSRVRVLAVYLWCHAEHERAAQGEHGPFWGIGQRPAIVDDELQVPPVLRNQGFGTKADGSCPHCRMHDGSRIVEKPDAVKEAIRRRKFELTGRTD